jgi:hypothetical protein
MDHDTFMIQDQGSVFQGRNKGHRTQTRSPCVTAYPMHPPITQNLGPEPRVLVKMIRRDMYRGPWSGKRS